MLCSLFAEVLGVERVGLDDNFFELGGDSIVSIQLVSRARQAGLSITPRAVFQHQTVEALAAAAGAIAAAGSARRDAASELAAELAPDLASGGLPATPIMHWLKARRGPIERFNQALLLRVPSGLRAEHLGAALQALLDHHDALRLRLMAAAADGEWSLEVAPAGAVAAGSCLRRIDVCGADGAALRERMAAEAQAAAGRLSPSAGVLVQAVWFDAGAERSGRLLLTMHHLAVDGVSWRILVPDLAAAWASIAAGRPVELSPRGTSFRRWAQRLSSHAQDASVTGELGFWRGMLSKPAGSLVAGSLDPGRDVTGTAGHLTLTLPSGLTQALLTRVPAAFHGGIDDVLLTGLAVAVADWRRRQDRGADTGLGSHAVLLDVEGHGREEVFADVDLTRTVGWFTSLYPVRLDPGLLDLEEALSGGATLGRALKTIKEQLRAVPRKGLGYGLLRYLNGATSEQLAGFAAPQLGFNYLGRFGGEAAGSGTPGWVLADDEVGLGGGDAAMPLAHCVEINALTLDGADGPRLMANWSWAAALLTDGQVRDLAESWFRALEALVRHALAPGAGGRSPSDLALVDLTQAEIERLEREVAQLEDILPLSPLQEGLLFHALYDAAAPDVYTVQLDLELLGALDGALLEASLQALVGRHASLRASFRHEGLSRPVQVIVERAKAPWRLIELSALDEAERERELARIIAADRIERFDVAAAPLMRFALIRLSADRHRLLISNHHLLMDGWSAPVLVRELLQAYAHQGSIASLPRLTPYRDYLAFIAGQDRAAAQASWRQALAGLDEATRLAPADPGRVAVAPEQLALSLGGPLSQALSTTAREQTVTLNTLVQVAWGILLGRLTGRDDVVFGVTVAGRPAEIAGIESMVGLFINTLPLRLRLAPSMLLSDLLRQTQDSQSRRIAHQHVGLAEIQQLVGLGELFDTLLVFENYPVDRTGLAMASNGIRLGAVRGHDATHYPLSLIVRPGDELQLRLDYRPDLFDRATVAALGERLVRLLAGAVAEPGRPIGSLEILAAGERDTILRLWNDTSRPLSGAGALPTLPALFAAQAARTPEATALVFEDRSLSYAALAAHANRLAHHLRGLGVGPETVVGLCVERSPEMVIGLMGILAAGGAYLPLDPQYPAERLAFMLRDAGAAGAGDAVGAARAAAQGRGRGPDRGCGGGRRHGARLVRLDADWPAIARQPRDRAGARPRPAPPGLRHLHLGLDRNPKGRRREHGGLSNFLPRCRSRCRLRRRTGCWR